jgi:hypothetical protein
MQIYEAGLGWDRVSCSAVLSRAVCQLALMDSVGDGLDG